MHSRFRAAALALLTSLALATLSSCNRDTSSSTGLNGFTISVPVDNLAIPVGGATTTTVSVYRFGIFDGDVTFVAEGVPAGVTVAFTPATVTLASSTTAMKISLSGAATAGGSARFGVRATATGYKDIAVVIPITVKDSAGGTTTTIRARALSGLSAH